MERLYASGDQPLFMSQVVECCERVMGEWLRGREKKQKAPKRVTAALIETASGFLLKPAYPAMSMRRIAAMAEVTEGAIFHYFRDKSGLWDSCRQHILTRVVAAAQPLIAEKRDGIDAMAAVAGAAGLSENELRVLFPTWKHLSDYIQQLDY
jgi:AcrR family transcriptional regulator